MKHFNQKHGHNPRVEGVNVPSPTYRVWRATVQRCNESSSSAFKNYGAKGIRICDRWLKFENFLEDMGERPQGMSLDRINGKGNYEKSNCRWATRKQQARNIKSNVKIFFRGEERLLIEVIEDFSLVDYETVRARLRRGWDIETALIRESNRGRRYQGN